MAMPWAGKCLPGADDFKGKKKSQPKCYVLEEESREVPQLLKLPCQHLRAVGWLAGSDKN